MPTVRKAGVELRRQSILAEIAEALGTTADETNDIRMVLTKTGVSSEDIASEFGDHRSLVTALAEMLATSMLEPLAEPVTGATFRQRLLAFGERVADEYAAPRLRCLYRITRDGAGRTVESDREFYHHGPGLLTHGLAQFLQAAQVQGVGLKGDSQRLAANFMALLRVGLDDSEALPTSSARWVSQERREVSRAINLFCFGIQKGARDGHLAH